ncbi:hypothetical protein JCM8208_005335 [Rhodotorula glutinis]
MSTRNPRQLARGALDEPATLHPTSLADSPDAALHAHVQDLGRICRAQRRSSSVATWARRNIVVAFLSFLVSSGRTYLWTLVVSPASVLFDPLSTIATLILFPVITAGLAVLVAVLYLFSLLGGRRIVNSLSNKYADGWSIVNWADPTIFGPRSVTAFRDAREALQGDVETTIVQEASTDDDNPDFTSLKTIRTFSLPLARTLLLLSSLIYERDDTLVDEAGHIIDMAQKRYPQTSPEYADALKRAEDLVVESEGLIKNKAAEWGLEFDGVSDLTTIGGPLAGIFFTPVGSVKPFICLVFKGTTPTRFQEFLTDATISKTGASVFFGPGSGTVHAGFYSDLFVKNDNGDGGSDGYGSIVRTLRHVAHRMQLAEDGDDKIPLWVAGHSLGSALASLCFARFLRSEADLGPDLELRDAYCYGTPRLGDGAFASAFEQTLVTPLDRKNILWRVRNHLDFVTSIPPGLGDRESSRESLSSSSILNFAWLGAAVRLRPAAFPFRAPYYTLERLGAFHEAVEVRVDDVQVELEQDQAEAVKRNKAAARRRAQSAAVNPLVFAMSLLPAPLYNHLPASYSAHLDTVWTTAQEEAAQRLEQAQSARSKGGELGDEAHARLQEIRRKARRAAGRDGA